MTQYEFEELARRHFRDRMDKKYVRNLAATLARLARIPLDHSLVALLGKGTEKDNADALESWVARELARCNLDDGDPLDYLYARVLCELVDAFGIEGEGGAR